MLRNELGWCELCAVTALVQAQARCITCVAASTSRVRERQEIKSASVTAAALLFYSHRRMRTQRSFHHSLSFPQAYARIAQATLRQVTVARFWSCSARTLRVFHIVSRWNNTRLSRPSRLSRSTLLPYSSLHWAAVLGRKRHCCTRVIRSDARLRFLSPTRSKLHPEVCSRLRQMPTSPLGNFVAMRTDLELWHAWSSSRFCFPIMLLKCSNMACRKAGVQRAHQDLTECGNALACPGQLTSNVHAQTGSRGGKQKK